MIVFIIGMSRSGSTFSFNVARDILIKRGSVFQDVSASVPDTLRKVQGHTHVILKAHHSDATTVSLVQMGSVKAICTVRKPEDSIASSMQTFVLSLREATSNMRDWLILFDQIRENALVLHYEKIEGRPVHAVAEIAQRICSDVRAREVINLARSHSKAAVKRLSDNIDKNDPGVIDIGYSVYEEKSLFHRNHVRSLNHSRAADYLSGAQIQEIRNRLESFIDERGQVRDISFSEEWSKEPVMLKPMHDIMLAQHKYRSIQSRLEVSSPAPAYLTQLSLTEQVVRYQEAFGALALAERVGSGALRSSVLDALATNEEQAPLCHAVATTVRNIIAK